MLHVLHHLFCNENYGSNSYCTDFAHTYGNDSHFILYKGRILGVRVIKSQAFKAFVKFRIKKHDK